MNPLFQLSTRSYDEEIPRVREALAGLAAGCGAGGGYEIGEPFQKFGWTFFDLRISEELAGLIERSGMMEGALGFGIGEQMKNFLGHYLESRGSQVRIRQLDYG